MSYLIVWADNNNSGYHTNFKLSRDGEQIALYNRDTTLVDSLTFGRQSTDISYGRKTDGNTPWVYFTIPTPGLANDTYSQNAITPSPQFSPSAGFYNSTQTVTMSTPTGSFEIRYTLDGTEPSESSLLYTSPIQIETTQVIRAKSYGTNYLSSPTVSQTFFINEPETTFPVVSLSTTPANLWDDNIGIYVEGTNGIPGNCVDYPVNWNQDWERPAGIEFYDENGSYQFQKDIGTKIYGGCTRALPQKSLAIIARNQYGDNQIKYPFFKDKTIPVFKSIVLRNSGNDWDYTMLRDAFMQALVKDRIDIEYQAYQPSILYINGEYWGILNIREKINEHYVSNNTGIDVDNLNLLENGGTIAHGDNQKYVDLLTFLETHDMTQDDNYQFVKNQIDIDDYIHYQITQIFVSNTDWPGNNVKFWSPASNYGRWRWILYDLDFGFGLYNSPPSDNTLAFALEPYGPNWPNPPWSTFLFRKLIENEDFKNTFIQRFAYHLNTTFHPDRVVSILDTMAANISPEMPRHIARWGAPYSIETWENNLQVVRNYALQRPDFVRQHICEVFGIPGTVKVMVNNTDTAAGNVLINGMPVIDSLYTGSYFPDIPLSFQVALNPGYDIAYWKITPFTTSEKVLLPTGSEWKYLDDGTDQGTEWYAVPYNDSAWKSGPAQLGYGDGDENTILNYGPDENNKYITYYFRKTFYVNDTSSWNEVLVRLLRDDGAIVYLNGEEIVRSNMPEGAVDYLTPSTTYVGGNDENTFYTYLINASLLDTGKNVIAVELHQTSGISSDISFDLELITGSTTEGEESFDYTYPLTIALEGDIHITPVYENEGMKDSLYINELMAYNNTGYMDNYGQYEDWIEVYNAGSKPVNIGGLYLTDNSSIDTLWQIPTTDSYLTTIQPGDFMVLWADNDTSQGILHLGFKLNRDGEYIGIVQMYGDEPVLIDSLYYGTQLPDQSYGRYPDEKHAMTDFTTITPGAQNIYSPVTVNQFLARHFIIYPNPTTGLLKIRFDEQDYQPLSSNYKIDVITITGHILYSEKGESLPGNEIELNMSHFSKGLYFIRIQTGNEVMTGKVYKR